jgi:two-component system chemotaxis sensor kinase CheA
MIEDQELCALFKMESEDHLQHLDEGLLRLEVNPQDSATLEEVFRAAHSLKGAARMLGVRDIETVAHHFEDALGAAKRGRMILSPQSIDLLYGGLDAIRKLVQEAVTGEATGVNVEHVLARLNGAELAAPATGQNAAERATGATTSAQISTALVPRAADCNRVGNDSPSGQPRAGIPTEYSPDIVGNSAAPKQAAPLITNPPVLFSTAEVNSQAEIITLQLHATDEAALPTPQVAFKIETIRVQPQKLDGLMTLAAELTVTTTRVARGLSACEEIVDLWEEWNKDVSANNTAHDATDKGARGASTRLGAARRTAAFYEREHGRLERLKTLLERLKRTAYEDVTRLNSAANELEESIRKIRLLPLSTVFDLFPRLVRDLAHEQSKEVHLTIEGETTAADKRILEELKDPLMHIIRNAVDHGIELPAERERNGKPRLASLGLRAYQTATSVVVEVTDDGRGLDEAAIKRTALKRRVLREEELAPMTREQLQMLIFAPGFSTSALVTDVSGRGVGLDVVRANVEGLHGTVQVQSLPGQGCTFRLQMPLTLATTRVLLVQVAGQPYALPVEYLQGSRLIAPRDVFHIEGRDTILLQGQPVSVAKLADLLELQPDREAASDAPAETLLPCIVLALGEERLGLFVEALLDEQEVILQPLGALLQRVRNVAGSTILGTGEVCMILNPQDLMKTMQKTPATVARAETEEVVRRQVILLAEDSITTRTQEKRIIESAGYEVVTAVDGLDAFNKLSTRAFDGVVSDVEMPNLDGLSLAARIRQDARYKELPIILVTSLASEEDRRRGIEVGANAYISKGAFEQKVLLDTLRRLV